MDNTVLLVFALVYLGLILGEIPGLAIDRTGIALLGGIALLATGRTTLAEAGRAIDAPTLALPFAPMVVSAQLRLGGFCTRTTRWIAHGGSPDRLLGLLGLLVGSIANLIVVDQARPLGVAIDWRTHARVGVPVTLATLAVAAAWLGLRAWMRGAA